MPPIVIAVISILQLALKLGPEVSELYKRARVLFHMWFAGGIITLKQQEELRAWADAHEKATLAGEVPPELQVEPDPS